MNPFNTVAIFALFVVQIIFLFVAFDGYITGLSDIDEPTLRLTADGNVILVTLIDITVICNCTIIVPLETVAIVVPVEIAVMIPLDVIFAIFGFAIANVTVLFVAFGGDIVYMILYC